MGIEQIPLAVVLPHKEVFAPDGAGAVSGCVRDQINNGSFLGRVAVLGPPVETPFEGPHFIPVPRAAWFMGSRTRRYLLNLARTLRKHRFALVEVHNRPRYIEFLRRSVPNAKLLLYLHNDPRAVKGLKGSRARARLLERSDAIVCVSDFIREAMLEGLESHPQADKVQVILNGTDTQRFRPGNKQSEILFVGRITPDKGAHLFAEGAVQALQGQSHWRAVMVGSRWFRGAQKGTPYEKRVFSALSALGPLVEITGFLPHDAVAERFRRATIAVVPSCWDEPCGLTAIEALSSGCALITTRRGGLPEVVGDDAIVLQRETPEALAEALRRLMDDPDLVADLQERGRKRALELLDIRLAAGRLDAIRTRLLRSTQTT